MPAQASRPYTIYDAIAQGYVRIDGHWGSDLDVIKDSLERRIAQNNKVVDLGCGTGWHLANLSWVYDWRIKAVGIDYFDAMLDEAKNQIRRFPEAGIKLVQADMSRLPLPDNMFGLALMLNNTLGVFWQGSVKEAAEKRIAALREARRILAPGGELVFSVYHRGMLPPEESYGANFRIMEEKTNREMGDLVVEYNDGINIAAYYSHWFTKDELRHIAKSSGFILRFIEPRMSRLVGAMRAEK
ncbi:class I SAM-dependent methyltransferase [Candidatus Woesearchaeota archaeon]|nr:class I SAM-dependent methyltransferase [Candidatus Woesearchaeota archaeon]